MVLVFHGGQLIEVWQSLSLVLFTLSRAIVATHFDKARQSSLCDFCRVYLFFQAYHQSGCISNAAIILYLCDLFQFQYSRA